MEELEWSEEILNVTVEAINCNGQRATQTVPNIIPVAIQSVFLQFLPSEE